MLCLYRRIGFLLVSKLIALFCLCLLAWLCNWLSPFLPLPIPGPLLGILCLLVYFIFSGGIPLAMQQVCQLLLKHMSLFFIPVTLSVTLYVEQLKQQMWILLLAILVSTALSLCITAVASHRILGKSNDG